MKLVKLILMVGLVAEVAHGQDKMNVPELRINPVTMGAETLKLDASGGTDKLRYREIEALKLSKDWQEAYSEPLIGEGGRVVYHYGESLHTVICTPLNVCDIQLQRGEIMRPPQIGDNIRWVITPGASGEGANKTPHIFVKPKSANLTTTMIVPTNRRTYHFQLKSTPEKYMAIVAFAYAEETKNEWLAYQLASEQVESKNEVDVEGINWNLQDLDFDYRVTGDKPKWRPVRVFNNGLKTVMQMPYAMKQTEAPAFMVVDEAGDEQIVNYRVRDNHFIVDKVFDKGLLIIGVGRKQTKVRITRVNTKSNDHEKLRASSAL